MEEQKVKTNEAGEEMGRVWDNFLEVGMVRKTPGQSFKIYVATRAGQRYIVVQEFYFTKKNGEWKPGIHSITIPLATPMNEGKDIILPWQEIAKMFEKAVPMAIEMELYDEANAVYTVKKPKLKRGV